MTTYFTQESEPTLNVNGRIFFDPHGNLIEIEEVSPPSMFPNRCSICHKEVRTKGFSHYRCRDVVSKLEKAKKNVVNLQFKLFCLKHTDNDGVNLDIYNIE